MEDDFNPITINTNNINVNIITTLKTDKIEINLNDNKNNDNIPIGPRMKRQKKNKKEDIELQIACEDEQERKERLFQEKLKKEEIILKNKNLIYKIDEENYNCVDCGKSPSNYISINNGITLCDDCAEIHKKFGQNISFLLNINDELDEYLFNFIVFGSNTKFKKFLEKENVDKNLNQKKKYKTNAVSFYRKILKNKVEGKQLPIKNYDNPNDIYENSDEDEEFNEFYDYEIEKGLIKNGQMIKQNKFINLLKNVFFNNKKNRNKKAELNRVRASVKENLIPNKNKNKNKYKINKKKYQNSSNNDNDKIKESSRPLPDEKTEPDKATETEEAPRINSTSEQMDNNNKLNNENK